MDNATQLQTNDIEPTDKRLKIFSLFMSSMEPLSAASLCMLLVGTRIHRATIFRTLALFEKSNIIRRVDFKEGEYRYELGSLPHHHHCICKTCGAIESIDMCTISETKKQIKKRIGFQVIDHAFTLFGICKKCMDLI